MPVRRLPRKTRKMRPCAAAGPKVLSDRRHRHQGPQCRAGDREGAGEARLRDPALPARRRGRLRRSRCHRRGWLPEHDRLDTECGHPVVPPRADGTGRRGLPRRPSGRTVGRRSRRPLRCRRRREAPGSSHCCFDPRDRRLGGLGIPAGEAQAVPGPGDVRAQGSKTERPAPSWQFSWTKPSTTSSPT